MLRSSAHVCRVSGNPTHFTKIVVRATFAPMATLPCAEHTTVLLDHPAGCAIEPVPDDVPG